MIMKNSDIYDYEWVESFFKDEWKEKKPTNIVAKFPMEQKVITTDGCIFAYIIDMYGEVFWYYHGSIGLYPDNTTVGKDIFKKQKPHIP